MNYRVYLSSKINSNSIEKGSGIIVIESDDYTKEQIQALRKKGYKILAYLSIGTIEKERGWYKSYAGCRLRQLEDWPNEYYADVRKSNWRRFLINRAAALKKRGCDGWWLDNIDVYSEYKSTAMFNAILSVFMSIKKLKGYVMVNGGSEWIDDALDKNLKISKYLNGYTQEEVISRILDYSGKGKFGTQVKEDSTYYKKMLRRARDNKIEGFCLEYTKNEKIKEKIIQWCKSNKINYYISGDVRL